MSSEKPEASLREKIMDVLFDNIDCEGGGISNAADAILNIPEIAEALEDARTALLADAPIDSDDPC
jgi:hypothetical protein